MDIRLILQDDAGKHFTLPVKDVYTVRWETQEANPSLVCLGGGDRVILELPAETVRTIYRDDGTKAAKPAAKPKAPKAAGDPDAPPAEAS